MKTLWYVITALILASMTSCVSTKKYAKLESDYRLTELENYNCTQNLNNIRLDFNSQKTSFETQIKDLNSQIDFLKTNSTKALNTLQEMSVMSTAQAESVKKSMEELSKKDNYIQNIQTAISHKDSMNLALIVNLKGAIGDINDKDINIKVDKGLIYIDISDKLLFNSGKYNVTPKAKIVLGKVAKVLNAYPDIEFMVEGHTDNKSIKTKCLEDNWDLSVKRATSVIRILEKEYNINPVRMTAAGHSEYIPIASNDTKEGKMLNRRTRIIILPQLDQFFKLLIKK